MRRLIVSPFGMVLATAAVLCCVTAAQAEITFLNKWGSDGFGDGQFNEPVGVAIAPTGQVYVVDSANQRIQRFDSDGTYELQWGSNGWNNGEFDTPSGVAVAATGQVYVTEYYSGSP